MPTDRPALSRGRFAALAGVAIAAVPVGCAVLCPGPLWLRVAVFVVAAAGAGTVAAFVIPAVLNAVERAEPAPPIPTPGPGDAVHRVPYAARYDGCPRDDRHDPHRWFWESDMPYVDGDMIAKTLPMNGSIWCNGKGRQ